MPRTRNTLQKTAILSAVRRAEHHPDAKWVYEQVSRDLPEISLGTVYRVLAGLSAEGLIREHPQPNGPALYDANTEEHFHVRCSRCGLIHDVPMDQLPEGFEEHLRRASGFARIEEFRLEVTGLCESCTGVARS